MTDTPEIVNGQRKPHQGKTLRMLRNLLGRTQAQLARENNMSQTKIFELEMKEELSEKELEVFSKYYGVSVLFLKRFDVDALSKGDVITNYNTLNDQSSLNSAMNNYQPLEKVSELYERIISLTEEIAILRYQLNRSEQADHPMVNGIENQCEEPAQTPNS